VVSLINLFPRSPNIITYKEAFIDEDALCIVMEYADNGDLFQKIVDAQKRNKLIDEAEVWKIIIQSVKGLKALHDLKILHRDLKSANVFLFKDGTAKLGDLNVSKVAKKGLLYTQTGTPYYASPEVWKDQPYDSKSDIWSLGCVLYETLTLKPPFRADDMQGLFKKVMRGYYQKIPSSYSQDMASLVRVLLQVAAANRPDCDRLLNMTSMKKRINDQIHPDLDSDDDLDNKLMQTIRVPRNLHVLTDRLPKANYGRGGGGGHQRRNQSEPAPYKLSLPSLDKKGHGENESSNTKTTQNSREGRRKRIEKKELIENPKRVPKSYQERLSNHSNHSNRNSEDLKSLGSDKKLRSREQSLDRQVNREKYYQQKHAELRAYIHDKERRDGSVDSKLPKLSHPKKTSASYSSSQHLQDIYVGKKIGGGGGGNSTAASNKYAKVPGAGNGGSSSNGKNRSIQELLQREKQRLNLNNEHYKALSAQKASLHMKNSGGNSSLMTPGSYKYHPSGYSKPSSYLYR